MAWCCQATSHYLSQCSPRYVSPYGITKPQWVKWIELLPCQMSWINCVYCETPNIRGTLVGNKIVGHSDLARASPVVAAQNYTFILYLTPGFNGLRKNNCSMRRETFKWWNLLCLILEILWYYVRCHFTISFVNYYVLNWYVFFPQFIVQGWELLNQFLWFVKFYFFSKSWKWLIC